MTTKDFRELDGNGFKVFVSTTNSKGRQLVTIVKGENARNKNEGEKIYQKEFQSFNRVEQSDIDNAIEAIEKNTDKTEEKQYIYIIASDSCNGEEQELCDWVNENYPNVSAKVENIYRSQLIDAETGEYLDEAEEFNGILWDKYC